MKSVAIVGNALLDRRAAAIDAADCVIRFNRPPHTEAQAGSRTDILFLINSGKHLQGWIADPAFFSEPPFVNCRQIVLPLHPRIISHHHPKPNPLSRLKGRQADWTWQAVSRFGAAGKEVTILPPQFYDFCCEELEIAPEERDSVFPSTGFLGIVYAMQKFVAPEWQIKLFGFAWEGWKRHDWKRERTWVDQCAGRGLIALP